MDEELKGQDLLALAGGIMAGLGVMYIYYHYRAPPRRARKKGSEVTKKIKTARESLTKGKNSAISQLGDADKKIHKVEELLEDLRGICT